MMYGFLAECQGVKIFNGLPLIIGEFPTTFSTTFVKDFPRFFQIFEELGNFFGFLGTSLDFLRFSEFEVVF